MKGREGRTRLRKQHTVGTAALGRSLNRETSNWQVSEAGDEGEGGRRDRKRERQAVATGRVLWAFKRTDWALSSNQWEAIGEYKLGSDIDQLWVLKKRFCCPCREWTAGGLEWKREDQSGRRIKREHGTSGAAGSLHGPVYRFHFLPEHGGQKPRLGREFALVGSF